MQLARAPMSQITAPGARASARLAVHPALVRIPEANVVGPGADGDPRRPSAAGSPGSRDQSVPAAHSASMGASLLTLSPSRPRRCAPQAPLIGARGLASPALKPQPVQQRPQVECRSAGDAPKELDALES